MDKIFKFLRNENVNTTNPVILFFRILGIIFIAEFIVMVSLEYFEVTPGVTEFVLDSIILSILSAPFLYYGVVRIIASRLEEEARITHRALENELTAKAQSERLALKAYSDNIVKSVTSGLIVASRDFRISSVNPALCQMISKREDELIGKLLEEVMPIREIIKAVEKVMTDGGSQRDITVYVPCDAGDRYYQVNINEIPPAEGTKDTQFLIIIDDITDRKEAENRILHMAYHDNLTGLPNRRLFIDRLKQVIARARRENLLAAVVFIDLDRFKILNDTLGHEGGDEILKTVSNNLSQLSRLSDTVARLGGDEFIVLLPDINRTDDIVRIIKRFIKSFNKPMNIGGYEFTLTASIGISVYPADGEDAETLIKNSDIAMYRAKAEGKNTWQFFATGMNESGHERITLENRLRYAIEKKDFVLNYQPQVDTSSGQIIGVEALVRWLDNDQGMVAPDQFIPIAEETGLIIRLGEWVLESACSQAREWQDAGLELVKISVNVSMRQFKQEDFVSMVRNILKKTGLKPEYLEIELTESMIMSEAERTLKKLHELKIMGIRLAIDDFGMGYSSLVYLREMPIELIKIDQSFVRDINSSESDAAICSAIISMARSLGIEVIAEGVETMEQLTLLRKLGCNKIQGYMISRPLSSDKVETFLKKDFPIILDNISLISSTSQ